MSLVYFGSEPRKLRNGKMLKRPTMGFGHNESGVATAVYVSVCNMYMYLRHVSNRNVYYYQRLINVQLDKFDDITNVMFSLFYLTIPSGEARLQIQNIHRFAITRQKKRL